METTKPTPPNKRQRNMLRRRGYDPQFYLIVRELNYSIFIKDVRTGIVKLLDKHC